MNERPHYTRCRHAESYDNNFQGVYNRETGSKEKLHCILHGNRYKKVKDDKSFISFLDTPRKRYCINTVGRNFFLGSTNNDSQTPSRTLETRASMPLGGWRLSCLVSLRAPTENATFRRLHLLCTNTPFPAYDGVNTEAGVTGS